MKKFAGTYVAVALLVALGAYVLFVEGIKPPDEESEKLMLDLSAGDITRIAIEQTGEAVEVERDASGEWAITAPRRVGANQAAVGLVADALAKLKSDRRVQEKAEDIEAFGFSSPAIRVAVTGKHGTSTVLVGAETPVGNARYAKLAESDPIYILGSEAVSALQKNLNDLREREMCNVAADSVTGLRIVQAGGAEVRLDKRADDDWRITQPFSDRADRWRVSDLIWDLTGLAAEGFVDDDGKDLAQWGLDRPRLRVEVISAERSSPLQVFAGAAGPDGKGFYVRTSDSASVYLVNPGSFSPFETGPLDLLDKTLVTWNDDDLLRVACEGEGGTVSFLRDGKGWKTTVPDGLGSTAGTPLPGPSGRPAAPRTYSSDDLAKLWDALRGIEAVGVAAHAAGGSDQAARGLDRPRVRVELDLGGGRTIELRIGAKGQGGCYAVVTGRNLVYVVDEEKVAALESATRGLSG